MTTAQDLESENDSLREQLRTVNIEIKRLKGENYQQRGVIF